MITSAIKQTINTHDEMHNFVSSTAFRMGGKAFATRIPAQGESAGKLTVYLDRPTIQTLYEAHVFTLPVPAINIENLIVGIIKSQASTDG